MLDEHTGHPTHGYEGLRKMREQYERNRLGARSASTSAYDRRNSGPSWCRLAVQIYGDSENKHTCAAQTANGEGRA